MEETPDIDTLLGIGAAPTKGEEYDRIATRLLTVREAIETLKLEEQELTDKIWTLTPDEPGEFFVAGDQYSFTVSRSELWKWDSSKIEAKLALPALPDYVKATFSVDKRKYLGMDKTEQADLHDALTTKPGAPRVKVKRNA